MGRIEFPHEFIITGDLLGKDYITQIGNVSVVVQMPIAEVSKEGLHVDLKSPYEWFEFDVGWGYVVERRILSGAGDTVFEDIAV